MSWVKFFLTQNWLTSLLPSKMLAYLSETIVTGKLSTTFESKATLQHCTRLLYVSVLSPLLQFGTGTPFYSVKPLP